MTAACLGLVLACLLAVPASAAVYPEGFSERVLADNLEVPTAVAWAPDGRMFITEKSGRLRVKTPGSNQVQTVLDISTQVNHASDRGLLGLAVDKDFATNRYVYLSYTYDVDPLMEDEVSAPMVSQVIRVEVKPDNTTGQQKVILGSYTSGACPAASNDLDCMPSDSPSHSIGTLISDPTDGTLWIGAGDASSFDGVDSLAYRTYDERSLAGKIIHVDREGKGLTGHPFCPTNGNLNQVCTKVWAKGFRNPFRFALRPDGRGLTIGDVGWNQREEVDLVRSGGGNYGWPCYEGRQHTPGYRESSTCADLYAKEGTPQAAILPTLDYSHDTGNTAIGGPTYTGTTYPAEYRGNIFYGDYGSNTLRRVTVDEDDQVTAEPQQFATDREGIVDLKTAPSGNLALVNIGSLGTDGQVVEIVYRSSDPVAKAAASPTSGSLPLTVRFKGSGFTGDGTDALTYSWDFGDGSAPVTGQSPQHTYTRRGDFEATVTARDAEGNTATDSVIIQAGKVAPAVTITAPQATDRSRIGKPVQLSGYATDAAGKRLAGAALQWRVLLHHNTHLHDYLTSTGEQASFNPGGDHDADSYYEVILTATGADGLKSSERVLVRPQAVEVTLASIPAGAPLTYAGRDVQGPYTAPTAVGFQPTVTAAESFERVTDGRVFYFAGWADDAANWDDADPRVRQLTVPETDFKLHALYQENKASLRPTEASSVEAPDSRLGPEEAVDGDRWTRFSSTFSDNQWWKVDLGRSRKVSSVRVEWERSHARQYRVQTSTDGVTFTDAATETVDAADVPEGQDRFAVTTRFTTRQARYVRLALDTRATTNGFSFWDVRVLGPDDDAAEPQTTIASGPTGTVSSTSASFGFSSPAAGAWFECKLDGGTWTACSAPKAYSALGQGAHTFAVRAISDQGIADPSPATRSFTVDTIPPDTQITAGPTGAVAPGSASFSFTSDPGTSFECRLDEGVWAPCTSPHAPARAGEGPHTFRVRAKDAAGNVDATPASRSFTVTPVPPDPGDPGTPGPADPGTPGPAAPGGPVPTPAAPPSPQKPPSTPARPTHSALVRKAAGLKAYFGMGGKSGWATNTAGGRGRYAGGPRTTAGLLDGGSDALARAFDGRNDSLVVPSRTVGPLKRATFALWVRLPARPRPGTLLSTGPFTLSIDGQGRPVWALATSGRRRQWLTGPALGGSSRHLAVSFDGQRLRLYVDGRLRVTSSRPVRGTAEPTGDLTVGAASKKKGPFFTGTIDELAVFDRALAARTLKAQADARGD